MSMSIWKCIQCLFTGWVVLISCHLGIAQPPFLSFTHFGTEEGLANLIVHDIIQDNKGFMWFANFRWAESLRWK